DLMLLGASAANRGSASGGLIAFAMVDAILLAGHAAAAQGQWKLAARGELGLGDARVPVSIAELAADPGFPNRVSVRALLARRRVPVADARAGQAQSGIGSKWNEIESAMESI